MERIKSTFSKKENIAITLLLVAGFVAAFIKMITGFDMDEAYALAMPYRLLQGDHLFKDMWEVHQTSSFLPALFLWIFVKATGSTTGIVAFMRIVTTMIHFALAIFVYAVVRQALTGETLLHEVKAQSASDAASYANWIAFVVAFAYGMFLPKWLLNMDFSMQQVWFFTLFVIFLLKGKERPVLLVVAGICLAFDVLAYPGMLILYVGASVALLAKKKYKSWLYLTAGCAILAVIFLIGVLAYMSPKAFLAAIPKVFMDGSHQFGLKTKLMVYVKDMLSCLIQMVALVVPSLLVAFVGKKIAQRVLHENQVNPSLGFLLCVSFTACVSLLICTVFVVTAWGPFRLGIRYFVQFIMSFYLLSLYRKKSQDTNHEATNETIDKQEKTPTNDQVDWHKHIITICQMTLLMSGLAFVGILLASNVGASTSASYIVLGNCVFLFLLHEMGVRYGGKVHCLTNVAIVLFLLSLVMSRGFYVHNSKAVPGDIRETSYTVTEGPLFGIRVSSEDAIRYSMDYATIQENTYPDDRVLYLGIDSLSNLYANGTYVSPTTISTPAFNEQWVEYFEARPEQMPTVVIIAKNTIDNREKFFAQNPFGIWIAEHYNVECMSENDTLCILR